MHTRYQEIALEQISETPDPMTPESRMIQAERERTLQWFVENALRHLPDREARVLRLSYGVDGCDGQQPSKIAETFGVSTSEVVVTREQALRHLREYLTLKIPRGWLEIN